MVVKLHFEPNPKDPRDGIVTFNIRDDKPTYAPRGPGRSPPRLPSSTSPRRLLPSDFEDEAAVEVHTPHGSPSRLSPRRSPRLLRFEEEDDEEAFVEVHAPRRRSAGYLLSRRRPLSRRLSLSQDGLRLPRAQYLEVPPAEGLAIPADPQPQRIYVERQPIIIQQNPPQPMVSPRVPSQERGDADQTDGAPPAPTPPGPRSPSDSSSDAGSVIVEDSRRRERRYRESPRAGQGSPLSKEITEESIREYERTTRRTTERRTSSARRASAEEKRDDRLTPDQRPRDDSRRPRSNSGRPSSESGRPRSGSGQPRSESGRPRSDSGQPRGESGRPRSDSGQLRTEGGRPRSTSGRPRDDTERPEQLLLEDGTRQRAAQLVEERMIFGDDGRRRKQYHYR